MRRLHLGSNQQELNKEALKAKVLRFSVSELSLPPLPLFWLRKTQCLWKIEVSEAGSGKEVGFQ